MPHLIEVKRKSDWQIFKKEWLDKDGVIKIIEKFRDDYLYIDWRIFKSVEEIEYIKIYYQNYDYIENWNHYDNNVDQNWNPVEVPIRDYIEDFIPFLEDISEEILDEHFSLKINKFQKIDYELINGNLLINGIKIELDKRAWKSISFLRLVCDCFNSLQQSKIKVSEINDYYIKNINEKNYKGLNSKDLTREKITNGYLKTINKKIIELTRIDKFLDINWELISHM